MNCENCRKSIEHLKYASVRRWCSAECRGEGRRSRARKQFADWRRAKLPKKRPDLELLLLDASPIGSWYYRLSCPGLGNGSKLYFPSGKGWRLRLFEPPAVPWDGFYDVVFYDEHGEITAEARQVPIVPQTRAPIGSGDHRREVRQDRRRKRPRSDEGRARGRKHRADERTASTQTPPDPPSSKCAFCNNVSAPAATASPPETSMDDTDLRAGKSGAPSADPADPPEVPHRSPSRNGRRSQWWPHRRAVLPRSVQRSADDDRDGQPTAPPEHHQDQDAADRDPSDQASRAPPKRPDG